MIINPDLLTEKEVQPLLRLRLKTLQQWRALRKGPRFTRLGRRVFYLRADIERFIADNTVDTDGATKSAANPERRER